MGRKVETDKIPIPCPFECGREYRTGRGVLQHVRIRHAELQRRLSWMGWEQLFKDGVSNEKDPDFS